MPKIKRLREIIPLIEEGKSYKEIGEHFGVATITVSMWVKKLREGGFKIKSKIGRKEIKL